MIRNVGALQFAQKTGLSSNKHQIKFEKSQLLP